MLNYGLGKVLPAYKPSQWGFKKKQDIIEKYYLESMNIAAEAINQ
jgi:hypothetical protein